MPTDQEVQAAVDQLTPVGQLVYDRYAMDDTNVLALQANLLMEYRDLYEGALTGLAEQLGCARQGGIAPGGEVFQALGARSADEAASIARTFNRDLAGAIGAIRKETPTANRNVYAHRLNAWEQARDGWKAKQIGMHVRGNAMTTAQKDFMAWNGIKPATATFEPGIGVCAVCQGLAVMGETTPDVAAANPTPIHPGCPHTWAYSFPEGLLPEDCDYLWMGA